MIAGSELTGAEQRDVVGLLQQKLEALDTSLAMAESEGKTKKAEKMQQTRTELVGRIDKVQSSKPVARKDKHHAEMVALRKRLDELDKLEKSKAILPLADVEKLAARPRLREDLAALEADSKGWFT